MTHRSLLGALASGFGLRVSRPGYDVTSDAIPAQEVAFDSRWLDAERVFMSGYLTGSATVSFGTTFPTVPIVLAAEFYAEPEWNPPVASPGIGTNFHNVSSTQATFFISGSASLVVNTNQFVWSKGVPLSYLVLRP